MEAPPLPALLADAAWVHRLARVLIRDAGAAEDVAQETLVAALERGGPAPSRRWLVAVLRNRVRLLYRGRTRRAARERAAARAEALEATSELATRADSLRRAVELVLALEEPYRGTVLLRYLEQLSAAAIAARQGVPVATVKTRLMRALERLRRAAGEGEDARPAWLVALAAARGPARGGLLTGGVIVGSKTQMAALAALVLACLTAVPFAVRALGPRARGPQEAIAAASLEAGAALEPAAAAAPAGEARTAIASAPEAEREPRALALADELRLLRGVVVDRLGRAVPGARLDALFDPAASFSVLFWAEPEREPAGSGETDVDGRFALELAPGRPVELEVRAEGFAPALVGDCTPGQELCVVLERGARLRGEVVSDQGGQPVGGGRVRVFHGDWVAELFVDEQGAFTFDELVPGEIGLLALPERAAIGRYKRFEVEPGGELEARLLVARGLSIAGRVIDARTGAPIPGASVRTNPGSSKRARADAGGRYLLEGVEPERPALLLATARSYASAQRTADPERTTEMDFELEPGVAAVGRVIDAAGAPVGAAHVLAWAVRHDPGIEPDHVATQSAADGSFRLEGLSRELGYELLVRAAGRGSEVFAVPDLAACEATLELGELRLAEPALLAGRVVDAGGAGVRAGLSLLAADDGPHGGSFLAYRPFYSDAEGRFALGDVAPGRYTLRAWWDGRELLDGYELALAPGERRTELVLQVASGLAIRGAVFDGAGRAVPDVMVYATREDGDRSQPLGSNATTDARGWFLLDGLAPGAHRLSASREEPGENGFALESAWLSGVEPEGVPLEIVLRPLDRRIAGLVLDAAGAPAADACVWIERGPERPPEPVRCDAAGRFELALAGDGAVALVARRTHHLSEDVARRTATELVLGRLIAPAAEGEARLAGVHPGAAAVVLRLSR